MKRNLIPTAIIAAAALGVIVYQTSQVSRLNNENTRLREGDSPENANAAAAMADNQAPARTGTRKTSDGTAGDETGRNPSASANARDLRDLMALNDPESRIAALLKYARDLQVHEIPQALEQLRLATPDWDPDAKMIAHIMLTRWANGDPEGALASLKGIDLTKHGADPVSVLSSVASQDPARALKWLEDPSNAMIHYPVMGHILAGTVAKEWVRQDEDAALAWARGLPDSQRIGALTGVLGTLAATNPQGASELAMSLDQGVAREHIVGEIAGSWARAEPAAAMDWASELTGPEHNRALERGLNSWARTAPTDAAQYVDQMDPDLRNSHLKRVADAWAAADPAAAAAWVADRDQGDAAGEALGSVMWHWMKQEPSTAADWLQNQTAGPTRDGGIRGLALSVFDEDPALALSWAQDISNDQARSDSVAIGMQEWLRRDHQSATDWASRNGVSLPEVDGE